MTTAVLRIVGGVITFTEWLARRTKKPIVTSANTTTTATSERDLFRVSI